MANKLRWILGVVVILALVGVGIWKFPQLIPKKGEKGGEMVVSPTNVKRPDAEFLELPAKTVEIMRLKTVLAAPPKYSQVLHLRGSLAIDTNLLVHVHSRFSGQIVELATPSGLLTQTGSVMKPAARSLQNFDLIKKDAPMAVIWSKDLGEKKSQLAEALAKLRLDRKTLANFAALSKTGSISDRDFREQRAKVELGEIATFTAEATLRSYKVSEEEIEQVKAESELIHDRQKSDPSFLSNWARVVVTAPIGGVIVDKNIGVGEIVDANAELFKIADLSVMSIWLHAYEEDLSLLQQLPRPLKVAVKVPASPELGELEGEVDRFGPIIDPNEHMALLIGSLKNPGGALRAGQFISADVGIPAEKGVVEIPANALIDVGNDAIVYVQPDRSKPRFQRRRVNVVMRHFDLIHVRSELSTEQKERGFQEVEVGDAVVAGGVLELEDYLQQQP